MILKLTNYHTDQPVYIPLSAIDCWFADEVPSKTITGQLLDKTIVVIAGKPMVVDDEADDIYDMINGPTDLPF